MFHSAEASRIDRSIDDHFSRLFETIQFVIRQSLIAHRCSNDSVCGSSALSVFKKHSNEKQSADHRHKSFPLVRMNFDAAIVEIYNVVNSNRRFGTLCGFSDLKRKCFKLFPRLHCLADVIETQQLSSVEQCHFKTIPTTMTQRERFQQVYRHNNLQLLN
jgi:hypothetical protein